MIDNQLIQNMVETANEFFLAGERAGRRLTFGNYSEHNLFAPTASSYALSIEINLKAMIVSKGFQSPKTHDIRKLHKKYFEIYADNEIDHLISPAWGRIIEILKQDGTIDEIKFNENDFYLAHLNYRYPYEYSTTEYLKNIRISSVYIMKTVKQKLPHIKTRFDRAWPNWEPDTQEDWTWDLYEMTP